MLKRSCLAACGLVALVVVASGCGSSKKASVAATATTSTNTTPTVSTPTVPTTQRTSATQVPKTTTARPQTPAPAKPPSATTQTQRVQTPKPKIKPEPKRPPKGKYEYPLQAQRNFIALCTASHASKSSCECILVKFESRKVEEGQSLAELLGMEVALQSNLTLSPRAQKYARECKSTLR